ncbi:hypothetical protein [Nostoc sp.]
MDKYLIAIWCLAGISDGHHGHLLACRVYVSTKPLDVVNAVQKLKISFHLMTKQVG